MEALRRPRVGVSPQIGWEEDFGLARVTSSKLGLTYVLEADERFQLLKSTPNRVPQILFRIEIVCDIITLY